jgi:murein DD-endopeptidase MepM/ murein hydrolase activator NlpD
MTTQAGAVVLGLLAIAAPAWAAAPSLELAPSSLRPGEPLRIFVRGADAEPQLTLGGRTLRTWRVAEGWQALTGLPVEQASGELEVRAVVDGAAPLVARLMVEEPAWRTRELEVAPAFTDKPSGALARRMAADRKAFEKAFARPFRPPRFKKAFVRPRGSAITAPFGDRRTFNGQTASQHYGLDLEGRVGEPVFAANDGVVVMVRDNFAAGRTVIVDHGAALFTVYFHLSKVAVSRGQRVRRGARLGSVGKSGRVTGPHLHWGVKLDGLYVDPEALLRMPFEGPSPTMPVSATSR